MITLALPHLDKKHPRATCSTPNLGMSCLTSGPQTHRPGPASPLDLEIFPRVVGPTRAGLLTLSEVSRQAQTGRHRRVAAGQDLATEALLRARPSAGSWGAGPQCPTVRSCHANRSCLPRSRVVVPEGDALTRFTAPSLPPRCPLCMPPLSALWKENPPRGSCAHPLPSPL